MICANFIENTRTGGGGGVAEGCANRERSCADAHYIIQYLAIFLLADALTLNAKLPSPV